MYIVIVRCESQPTGSGVEWAECSLIIGMGYGVQILSLILDSPVGLSAGIRYAGDSVPETPVRILHSADSEEDNLSPLPQSGGREFDPGRVHDNLSVPLWIYMGFPVPKHQN